MTAPDPNARIFALQLRVGQLYDELRGALAELDELRAQRRQLFGIEQTTSPPRLRVIAGGRS